MYVLKLKNILLGLAIAVVALVGTRIFLTKGKKVETISKNFQSRIVVDAGHGLPDGGASNGDVYESSLNLMIAKKLEKQLTKEGYEVIMTREDENNVATENVAEKIASIKASDLNHRVEMINESGADFCVSIHLNKFNNPKYWGWQTFYNKTSEEGKNLATCIQNGMEEVIQKNNKRTALKIEGIKIVDKTTIPVVIVECGFISNPEEVKLLQEDDYQEKLAEGICKGIQMFYNEEKP